MTRILVVEDEPGIALGLEDDLTIEGYEIEVAGELVAQHQLLQGGFRTSRVKEHFEGLYKLKRDNNKIRHERRLDDLKKPLVESLIFVPPIDVERRDLSTYDLFMGGLD